MDELDRLGWAAGLTFTAHGVRLGVRVSDASVLDRIPALLPLGWKPGHSPSVDDVYSLVVGGSARPGARRGTRRFHLVYSGSDRVARTELLDDALRVLQNDMEFWVAAMARNRTFLHSGAVALDGRALLLPGPSGVGKSRLVEALLRAGADYLSDEYAPLDLRGRVHPYPRPLAPAQAGRGALRALEPASLGARTAAGPVPVAAVLLTRYRSGARWRPRKLSAGEGVLRMLRSAIPARHSCERTLEALSRVSARAPVLSGARGEASETAPRILDWFAKTTDRRLATAS